jgi:hypothetical protein
MQNHCRLLPAIICVVVTVQTVLQMAEHSEGEDWIGEGADSESELPSVGQGFHAGRMGPTGSVPRVPGDGYG